MYTVSRICFLVLQMTKEENSGFSVSVAILLGNGCNTKL